MYLSGRNSKSVRGSPMKLRRYLGLAAHHEREMRVLNCVITWRSSEAGDAVSVRTFANVGRDDYPDQD